MMLSGQVHLCHLLAPNQVCAFNQTNDDLSGTSAFHSKW